jgi:hypothetical protein
VIFAGNDQENPRANDVNNKFGVPSHEFSGYIKNKLLRSRISGELMKTSYLVILAAIVILMSPLQANKLTCHLHVPVDIEEFKDFPAVIPDLGTVADCERENDRRLGSKGRCHCTFSGAGFRQYQPAEGGIEDGRPAWLE